MIHPRLRALGAIAGAGVLCSCTTYSGLKSLQGYESVPAAVPMDAIAAAREEGPRELASTTYIPPIPIIGFRSTKFERNSGKENPLAASSFEWGLLHTRLDAGTYDGEGNRMAHVQMYDAPLLPIYCHVSVDAPEDRLKLSADAVGFGLLYFGAHARTEKKGGETQESDVRALLGGGLWLAAKDEEGSDHGILWAGFGWEKKDDHISPRIFWTRLF